MQSSPFTINHVTLPSCFRMWTVRIVNLFLKLADIEILFRYKPTGLQRSVNDIGTGSHFFYVASSVLFWPMNTLTIVIVKSVDSRPMPLDTQLGGGPVESPRLMGGRDNCPVIELFKIIMIWFCLPVSWWNCRVVGRWGGNAGFGGWESNWMCENGPELFYVRVHNIWSTGHHSKKTCSLKLVPLL